MDSERERRSAYEATSETQSRWGGAQRTRALILIPFAAILLLRAMRGDSSAAPMIIGIAIALGIVAFVVLRGRGRTTDLPAGAEWRGSASAQIDDLKASPRLSEFAPAGGLRGAMTGGVGLANGTLTITRSDVSWEPARSAKSAKARGWSLPLSEVVGAEIGAIPGAPSIGALKKVNQGLRLHLNDGSSISFVLMMPRGLDEALARVGIAPRSGSSTGTAF